jgi:DNA-binding protein H-NS
VEFLWHSILIRLKGLNCHSDCKNPFLWEGSEMKLKSMSIARLTTLRDKVETALKARVTQTRHDLEGRLAKLSQFGKAGGRGISLGMRRGPVAPKYRNPENPNETWAGRGLKPRWLAAAIKAGHKPEDFLIDGAPKVRASKTRKSQKVRKAAARKPSKPRKVARKAKAAGTPATPRKASELKAAAQLDAGT